MTHITSAKGMGIKQVSQWIRDLMLAHVPTNKVEAAITEPPTCRDGASRRRSMACARPSACWMVLTGNDKVLANMQGPSMPMHERDPRMAGGELLAGTLR